jgi:hypothetical protein
MILHTLVAEDPRYLDIQRRREELAEQRRAHRVRVQRETEKHKAAQRRFEKDMARAVGDEEVEALTPPVRSAVLETELAVSREHIARAEKLNGEEAALLAAIGEDLAPAFLERKMELRARVHELLAPIVDELRRGVDELNVLLSTEYALASAAARSRHGAGGIENGTRWPDSPKAVTAMDVIASVVDKPVAVKKRDRRSRWQKERDRAEAAS